MSWGEAWRLTEELLADPSSHVFAAINKWSHPATREALILADLVDAFIAAHSKKSPTRRPRPWDEKPKTYGVGTSMTVEQYRALRASVETP
jgi:hypothetical protein